MPSAKSVASASRSTTPRARSRSMISVVAEPTASTTASTTGLDVPMSPSIAAAAAASLPGAAALWWSKMVTLSARGSQSDARPSRSRDCVSTTPMRRTSAGRMVAKPRIG